MKDNLKLSFRSIQIIMSMLSNMIKPVRTYQEYNMRYPKTNSTIPK